MGAAMQGQLFAEDEALPLEDLFQLSPPARDDWIFKAPVAFDLWITHFAEHSKGAYSDVSINQFKAMFGAFWKFLLDCNPKQSVLTIGADGINRFLGSLEGRDPTPQPTAKPEQTRRPPKPIVHREIRLTTKGRYIHLLNDLMDHLVECGYRKQNPMLQTSRLIRGKNEEPDVVFLTVQEDARLQQYLLQECRVDTWEQRRYRALTLLMLGSGVTVAHALGASVDDFVFNDQLPLFVPKKELDDGSTKSVYAAVLDPFCVEPIVEWLNDRREHLTMYPWRRGRGLAFPTRPNGGQLTTPSAYNYVKACLEAIGFSGADMGARVLRYTFIRRQIIAGLSDQLIQERSNLQTDRTLVRVRKLTPTLA
ncbi:tyrosine-type recombinase/integrase [Paraburkholderia sp. SIMBA_054]|uniref:tyrosine-type recombinase/integrase n=1 Tax=Paraburkholderia sp. SIMBA_054 TaxID=3085795 RepID=UPI00397C8219